MLTLDMFCHKFLLLDGGGAGPGDGEDSGRDTFGGEEGGIGISDAAASTSGMGAMGASGTSDAGGSPGPDGGVGPTGAGEGGTGSDIQAAKEKVEKEKAEVLAVAKVEAVAQEGIKKLKRSIRRRPTFLTTENEQVLGTKKQLLGR